MRLTLVAASLLLAVPAIAQDVTPFTCEGVFGPDTTHEKLVAEFGADNVVFGQIIDDEATFPEATTVFPLDPAKRVSIMWRDDSRETPRLAFIGDGSTRSVGGVLAGMSIDDVEAMNGRPFQLGGFNDMERGQVTSWEGGNINTDLTNCEMVIAFGYRAFGMPMTLNDPLDSEGPYPSTEPAFRVLGAKVTEIVARYPTE